MLNNSKVIEILKEHKLDPTEDNLIYVLERIYYYDAFVLFDYMEYNEFCEILEGYHNYYNGKVLPYKYPTEVRYYKHLYLERVEYDNDIRGPQYTHFLSRKYIYTIRDLTDEDVMNDKGCWYQDLKKWTRNEGKNFMRKYKMKRIEK